MPASPSLRPLQKAINNLRSLDDRIPIGVIVVLMALSDGEEVEVRDLQADLDMTVQSIFRALTYLGEHHWNKKSKKGGLNLVSQRIPLEDRRQRLAKLTPKGVNFIKQLEEIL